jgi:hypothetical protein
LTSPSDIVDEWCVNVSNVSNSNRVSSRILINSFTVAMAPLLVSATLFLVAAVADPPPPPDPVFLGSSIPWRVMG